MNAAPSIAGILGSIRDAPGRLAPMRGRDRARPAGMALAEPTLSAPIYCASFVINLLALALPLTILQVYDRVIPNASRGTLVFLFLGLVVALAFEFILKTARSALLFWLSHSFVLRTSEDAIERLLRTTDDTVERQPSAAHINRYAAISALGEYHAGPSRLVTIDLPFAAIAFVVMMLVGGVMVLIPVLLFFLFAALAIRRNRQFRDVIEQRSAQDNKKYDFVVEALTGILTIKGMAMEPQMQRRFERLQQAVAEITSRSIIVGHAAQNSALLYGSLSQVVVVGFGAHRVIEDNLSIGALACCTLLSGQILQPLLRAITSWTENETADHRRSEIAALLALPVDEAAPASPRAAAGPIRFDRVGFSYPDQPAAILKDVGFELACGTVAGLKGEDGSGRSTILRLLRGELLPTAGQVVINGVATSEPAFAAVRHGIVSVGATPAIFRGSILDNLTLFREDRRHLARAMSKLVGLDAAINLLPEGFDTKLGEGLADDLPISVAQQINIVRAMTTGAPVIVLDEANTVLDRTAEAALIRAIKGLDRRRTIIIATHRPSLLAICDVVMAVARGRVETGAPQPGAVVPSRAVQ